MFGLFSKAKKEEELSVYSLLHTDMHSHLLPGIDDGAPDLRTSLSLVRGMTSLGYRKLITTPHVLWDMYKNTSDDILRSGALLKKAVLQENIPVQLEVAAEYFLDDHVSGLLKKQEKLLTFGQNMVLTEFSLAFPTHGIKEIFFEMQMQGYHPVVAHPERYIYLQSAKEFYDELKDIGCMFQLNILSLAGHYGKAVQELAHYLQKKGYYELAGTDLHHPGHLGALQSGVLKQQLKKLAETAVLKNPEL